MSPGLTLLASRPKIGKSWLALDLALALTCDQPALGSIKVDPGALLYLALEDTERRLKDRLTKLLGDAEWPERLSIKNRWRKLDGGALEDVGEWIVGTDDPRLVIVDTFAKLRKVGAGSGGILYNYEYEETTKLKDLGDSHDVGVLLIHHTRKLAASDPLDEVSGSTGITRAADTILVAHRDRGKHDATLHVTGREVDEQELALAFDKETCRWSILGQADALRMPAARSGILQVLREAGKPLTPTEVAKLTGMEQDAARQRLWQMAKDSQVSALGGCKYQALEPGPANSHNAHNAVTGFAAVLQKLGEKSDVCRRHDPSLPP
jgi:hypothetical protein